MKRSMILVADSNPNLVTSIVGVVKEEGYGALTAQGGKDAIEKCKSARPDLLICGVMMSGINGFQVARTLTATEGQSLQILLMSEKCNPADVYWAKDAGAVGLLKLPVDHQKMSATIAALIQERSGR